MEGRGRCEVGGRMAVGHTSKGGQGKVGLPIFGVGRGADHGTLGRGPREIGTAVR
jgi:hypothetical protein